MHNHPSGDPIPSETDIRLTRELIRASDLVKIQILDHVNVGRGNSHPRSNWGFSLGEVQIYRQRFSNGIWTVANEAHARIVVNAPRVPVGPVLEKGNLRKVPRNP